MLKRYKIAIDSPYFALSIHLFCVLILYTILTITGVFHHFPSNQNLIRNDAIWYLSIVEDGYYYSEGRMNSMAFFPFFPYVWKFLDLTPIGISILNGFVFLLGTTLIIRHLNLSFLKALIIISTPSLFFCYIPYSEAFFFLGSTFILIGIDKQKFPYIAIGTIITSLTRSVGIIFFPALIYLLVINWKKNDPEANSKWISNTLWPCVIIIMSTILVLFFQYIETGEWLVFFKVQQSWNRSLSLPKLPFTTMTGTKILWLDGLALLVSIISFCILLKSTIYFFLKNKTVPFSPSTSFSLVYLTVIGFICSFFSGSWETNSGTSLMSINRYIFAGPFFIIFTSGIASLNTIQAKFKNSYLLLLMTIISWLFLGLSTNLYEDKSYCYTIVYFFIMTLYLYLYHIHNIHKLLYILLYIVNLFIQLFLLNLYLTGSWVG
ncbi:hypothetical protein DVR12_26430 [Chitinophaga silvatica]|uniref:Mannosyltransferase (PIG-V) n=1 Tax=Chitinophaga silvatica TaxID=2282649 RepID=A0A3E1Y2K0_9BACT|nr:hypothetical protein DVR12_26430 [Chitinophaga silvatica]